MKIIYQCAFIAALISAGIFYVFPVSAQPVTDATYISYVSNTEGKSVDGVSQGSWVWLISALAFLVVLFFIYNRHAEKLANEKYQDKEGQDKE